MSNLDFERDYENGLSNLVRPAETIPTTSDTLRYIELQQERFAIELAQRNLDPDLSQELSANFNQLTETFIAFYKVFSSNDNLASVDASRLNEMPLHADNVRALGSGLVSAMLSITLNSAGLLDSHLMNISSITSVLGLVALGTYLRRVNPSDIEALENYEADINLEELIELINTPSYISNHKNETLQLLISQKEETYYELAQSNPNAFMELINLVGKSREYIIPESLVNSGVKFVDGKFELLLEHSSVARGIVKILGNLILNSRTADIEASNLILTESITYRNHLLVIAFSTCFGISFGTYVESIIASNHTLTTETVLSTLLMLTVLGFGVKSFKSSSDIRKKKNEY